MTEGLSNEQLKHFLMTAKSDLTVVVPWFIDPLTIGDALKQILATEGASVTVFFLDPSSPHLAERGRVARPDLANYGPGETRRSIAVLGPLFASAKAKAQIRTYNSIPSAFIVRMDAKAFIGFHMHTGVATKTPILFFNVFEAGELTSLGRMIEDEFTKLKTISRSIDASSVQESSSGIVVFSYTGS